MIAKNFSHKEALKIILSAADNYHKILEDKNFMIIYYENGLKYKLIKFAGENFCHLTGAKTNHSATKFYNLCMDKKLSVKDFAPPSDTMNLKLAVLPYLPDLLFNHCSIGNFINSGIELRSDYFVGNSKNILSVGFLSGRIYDIPRTLLNKGIKQLTYPTLKVEAIFRKNKTDTYYSEYTYCNKNFDLNILNNCEFSHMIKDIHYYKDNTEENKATNKSDFVKKSNLSLKQVAALAESGIPFNCKKMGENSFVIVFERENIEKINQTLSSVSEQEQPPHQPKIKR